MLRLVLVAAQAVTLGITWPLWSARESLPHLPAIPGLPGMDVGYVLLATLTLTLFRPRLGILLHTVALVLAMLMDQLRIQPQFVSMTLLLWGTLPSVRCVLVARAHLVALYLYGGLHKLLGEGYVELSGPGFWMQLMPALDHGSARTIAVLLAGFEVAAGLLLLVPVVRRPLAWALAAMHIGIVAGLVSFMAGRNEAVWAWNLALAVAAVSLVAGWREPLRRSLVQARGPVLALCAFIVLSPALYRIGRLDAYLAFCLYADTPSAVYLREDQLQRLAASGRPTLRMPTLDSTTTQAMNVPVPPAHRLYEAWYHAVHAPGDVMLVHDPRPWAAERGRADRIFTTGGDHAHLVPDGEWLDFHPSAGLASRGPVKQGVKHGAWESFYTDGSRKSRGEYADGHRVGSWTTWERSGAASSVRYDADGRRIR